MRVLVTGATGLLGGYVVAELARGSDEVLACGGPLRGADGVDLLDSAAVDRLFKSFRPDLVVHTAAAAAMADCARDPKLARRTSVEATAHVARAREAASARFVHVSTDLVFDGEHAPYDEGASTAPTSVYGATKLDAERVAHGVPHTAVVPVSLLFGPTRTARRGFFDAQLETLRAEGPLTLFDDEWRTPMSLRAAAEGLVAIGHSDVTGTFHLGGPERMSRYEMGVRLARTVGCSDRALVRGSRKALTNGEPRPRDVSLDSSKVRSAFPALNIASFEAECLRMLRHPAEN